MWMVQSVSKAELSELIVYWSNLRTFFCLAFESMAGGSKAGNWEKWGGEQELACWGS
jgi:hypothetical protein